VRLTTLTDPDGSRVGVLDGDVVRLLDAGPTLLDVIAGGAEALADVARRVRAGDVVPLDQASFGPLLAPTSVRDFLTYEAHLAELAGSVPDEWYEQPLFYFGNPASVVAPYADVRIPPLVTRYDYELEVAAVVGRAGADLTPEQAADHIIGYTIFNDWSARDLQVHEFKFPMGPSKSKDGAITLGPWLVTADELEPFRDDEGFLGLDLRVSVNGTEVGQDLLSNMGWPFEELISYASRGTVVRAGDVLGSGTCGNGGCLAELWGTRGEAAPPPLQPGDVVEMTVEGIGTIRNRVVEGVDLPPVAPARKRPRNRRRTA
jgi:2-keto-4-pentenoate hydratase/2-oxohepta-3-ene-1,7-dioic acid hydratase in catechol pathway